LPALIAALALASCGGEDEPQQVTAPAVTGTDSGASTATTPAATTPEDEPSPDPEADEEAITATLRGSVLTSADPRSVCDELVTENYVEAAYGDVAGCRRAQADASVARHARVSRIVISPESVAQASVMPDGGVYAGERLRAELVLDGGQWRVDSLRSNVPVGP
jgi:hypothetical protein